MLLILIQRLNINTIERYPPTKSAKIPEVKTDHIKRCLNAVSGPKRKLTIIPKKKDKKIPNSGNIADIGAASLPYFGSTKELAIRTKIVAKSQGILAPKGTIQKDNGEVPRHFAKTVSPIPIKITNIKPKITVSVLTIFKCRAKLRNDFYLITFSIEIAPLKSPKL